MNLNIDNDFQQKVMTQSFVEPVTLAAAADVQAWRSAWMAALSSWHSPYKVLVDCAHLRIAPGEEVSQALALMIKFFNGFFLRKIVGFNRQEGCGHELLPFPVVASIDEAAVEIGIRQPKDRKPGDFRSAIQLQNHFQQHVIELSFAEPVTIAGKEQITTLRSKISNNLMQWHSKWSLLIDCANLEIAPAAVDDFTRMTAALKGFFMKDVIGYAPRADKSTYPFAVFRARHRAAAELSGEGNFSGDAADCQSRKT